MTSSAWCAGDAISSLDLDRLHHDAVSKLVLPCMCLPVFKRTGPPINPTQELNKLDGWRCVQEHSVGEDAFETASEDDEEGSSAASE